MQITSNTTGMEAGICVSTNKEGYDFCVVVIKGTYSIQKDGSLVLSDEQVPMVYADEHYGEPGSTPIQYEGDFSPYKPNVDIIVHGHAYSEIGKPVRETTIGLAVGQASKIVRVFGNRFWMSGLAGFQASRAEPFIKVPLTYSRAFGGVDHFHKEQKYHGAELRNPVGVGYLKNSDSENIEGAPLPNFEDPSSLISNWSDKPSPMGFGVIGRGWQPRIKYAGTYDQEWQDNRFPFLPEDFDERYFHSAPQDQQLPSLLGGELVRCVNMTPERLLVLTVPAVEIPVTYYFRDKTELVEPKLDTFLIEPDEGRVLITWRCRIILGRKLNALREIKVGHVDSSAKQRSRNGKPYFKSIADYIAWKKGR